MADTDQDLGRDASIGERLRSAREARGLTLDDVAAQTRIPIRHLRAIEDGNWSELPAVTYTVGFARSYANAVGLDGAEVGRQVRDEVGGSPQPTQLAPVYYSAPDPARVPSRPLAWIAALLAVVLIGGYIWWRSRLAADDPVAATPPAAEQPAADRPQARQPQAPLNLAGQPVTLVANDKVWLRISDGARKVQERILEANDRIELPPNLQQPRVRTYSPQRLHAQIGGRDLGPLGERDGTVIVDLSPAALSERFPNAASAPPAAAATPAANGFRPLL